MPKKSHETYKPERAPRQERPVVQEVVKTSNTGCYKTLPELLITCYPEV